MISRSIRRHLLLGIAVVTVGLLGACGDDDTTDAADSSESPTETDDAGTTDTGGDDSEDDGEDDDGGSTGASGSGTATLTIGDETWEFDTVQCAEGTDQTQSDEYDFVLSAIQGGLQLTADRGTDTGQFGDGVRLDDIDDFENPSVSWSAPALDPTASGDDVPFVEVDGKQVTAEANFTDGTLDPGSQMTSAVPGTLTATCP